MLGSESYIFSQTVLSNQIVDIVENTIDTNMAINDAPIINLFLIVILKKDTQIKIIEKI